MRWRNLRQCPTSIFYLGQFMAAPIFIQLTKMIFFLHFTGDSNLIRPQMLSHKIHSAERQIRNEFQNWMQRHQRCVLAETKSFDCRMLISFIILSFYFVFVFVFFFFFAKWNINTKFIRLYLFQRTDFSRIIYSNELVWV